MLLQLLLNIYYFTTLIISSYYFYDLYKTEDSFYLFSLRIVNSIFYILLSINLLIMVLTSICNLIIYLLFGKITSSEFNKIKVLFNLKLVRILNSLESLMLNKIDNIIQKLVMQIIGLFMFLITEITYIRGEYFNTNNEINKIKQLKIIGLHLAIIYINYLLYTINVFPDKKNELYDFFICNTINYDNFYNFIKIVEGFFKLMVNITCINMRRYWNNKIITFDIISLIKYLLCFLYEIKICYLMIINKKCFTAFILYILKNIIEIITLIKRIYSNYYHLKNIQSLTNYDINEELEIQGEINKDMTEEEINQIKKEKINKCIICFSEIEKGKYLNCGHVFHLNCIKEWIFYYKTCPMCKCPIKLDSNEKTDFYNKRLGIKNLISDKEINNEINNDAEDIEESSSEIVNEEKGIDHNNKLNNEKDDNNNSNKLIDKYLEYKKIYQEKEKIYEGNKKFENCKPGAVSYGLPTEALYVRNIENEYKRLKIELVNEKLINCYQEPEKSLNITNNRNFNSK